MARTVLCRSLSRVLSARIHGNSHLFCRHGCFTVDGHSGAPYTPMKDDGRINFDFDFKGCTEYLCDVQKFSCLFVNGTSGESISLTVDERIDLAKEWRKSTKGKIPVILHIGTSNLEDSKKLAKHARELGVEAIVVVSPSYFKPMNEDALVDYIKEVASCAPNLAMFYYCIDFMTNVNLNDAKVMKKGREKIPSLVGMKHSTPDLASAHSCMQVDKSLQILFGTDTLFLPCLSLGLGKPIMSPFLGEKYHQIKEAFYAGDLEAARKVQDSVFKLNSVRQKYGSSFSIPKTMFSILTGYDVGDVRLPLTTMSSEDKENFRKDLQTNGFL